MGIISLVYPALVVLTAPYMGTIRTLLETRSADLYVPILKTIVALGVGVFIFLILSLLRTRTLRRLAGLGLMTLLVGVQTKLTSTPYPQINWIERIHFFEYALMSVLFWVALKTRFPPLVASILAWLATARVGVVDEFVQWIVPVRVGDIRDVELNFASGLLGQLFILTVLLPSGIRGSLRGRGGSAILVSVGTLIPLVVLFFGVVHTGYVIRDPGIGEFRSRYTLEELEVLSGSRLDAGDVGKSKEAVNSGRRFRIRDFYHSEGIAHIWSRNDYRVKENMKAALKEQAIIEGYYPASLRVMSDRTSLSGMLTEANFTAEALASSPFQSEQFKDVLYTSKRRYLIIPAALITMICLVLAARLRRKIRQQG